MLKSYEEVMDTLRDYSSPKSKLTRMIAGGDIFRIARGVYGTEATGNPRFPVASLLDPTSYVSFETALAYHRLIPMKFRTVRSASNRKRKRVFKTEMGSYEFLPVPSTVYAEGQLQAWEQGRSFRIATAEKALCDLLYVRHGYKSQVRMEALLFSELEMDRSRLEGLDWDTVERLATEYPSTTLHTLLRWRTRHLKAGLI